MKKIKNRIYYSLKHFFHLAFFLIFISFRLTAQETAAGLYAKALEMKMQRNCTEVLKLIDRALELKPDFADALLEKGWCLNELNRPQEAVSVLYKSRGLMKNNYLVSYEMGHAYFSLNIPDSSEKYFLESFQLKKDNQLAAIGLGDLYREKKQEKREALNWYLVAAGIDSNHKKTNYWIGWSYNELKKHDSAVFYLKKILIDEPSNALASVELGFAYYFMQRFSASIAAFKPAIQSTIKPSIAIFYTGMCHVKTGNKSEALNSYNELVILNSPYAVQLLTEIQQMKN